MTATVQPALRPDRQATLRPPLRLIEGGRSGRRQATRYRRRRIFVASAVVAVAAVLVLGGRAELLALRPAVPGAHPVPAVGRNGVPGGRSVIVGPGDTLWSIAQRAAPEGDVRAAVDRLAAVHGTGPLQVGERLPLAAAKGG